MYILSDMETKIQKWGNSLGIRLPKSVTQGHELAAGSVVRVTTKDKKIILERVEKPSATIDELVASITKDNLHQEINWGKARGNEIW